MSKTHQIIQTQTSQTLNGSQLNLKQILNLVKSNTLETNLKNPL